VREEYSSRKINMLSSGAESDESDSDEELERPGTGNTQGSGFSRGRLDGFATSNTPSKRYCTDSLN
jgi:hypothetical protein